MAEHDPVGVAALAQGGDGGHPVLGGVDDVEAEAVHAEDRAGVGQLHQVVEVVAVARVPDHDLGEVHALLAEDVDDRAPGVDRALGVHGERRARLAVRSGDGPQHPLHAGGEPGAVDGALQERRLHAGAADALGEVPDEQGDHRVGALVQHRARPSVVELEGHVVVGVDARRHDDVEPRDPLVDPLDPGDVAPEPPHGRVGDGGDAAVGQLTELGDRVSDLLLLVPPVAGPVVLDVLGAEDEDVLVHQRASQPGDVDGASDGLHCGHRLSLVPPAGGIPTSRFHGKL